MVGKSVPKSADQVNERTGQRAKIKEKEPVISVGQYFEMIAKDSTKHGICYVEINGVTHYILYDGTSRNVKCVKAVKGMKTEQRVRFRNSDLED